MYGTKPIRLIIIIITNKEETIVEKPFSLVEVVRVSWLNIIVIIGNFIVLCRFADIHIGVWTVRMINRLNSKKIMFEGNSDLNTYGSKDEKISGIMQDLDCVHLKLWRLLVYLT